MRDTLIRFGDNIKHIRIEKGFTQDDLATILAVDKSYISRIENGRINLTVNSILKISEALKVNIVELFK